MRLVCLWYQRVMEGNAGQLNSGQGIFFLSYTALLSTHPPISG